MTTLTLSAWCRIAESLERLNTLAEAVMFYFDIAIPATADEVRNAGRGIDYSVVDEDKEARDEFLREFGLLPRQVLPNVEVEDDEIDANILAPSEGPLTPL